MGKKFKDAIPGGTPRKPNKNEQLCKKSIYNLKSHTSAFRQTSNSPCVRATSLDWHIETWQYGCPFFGGKVDLIK
uniref:Uncharacterized protein n=1 Tax=Romanomermis culicivorax TaxID=13658 RepID=A0A915I3U8_ROMCU